MRENLQHLQHSVNVAFC